MAVLHLHINERIILLLLIYTAGNKHRLSQPALDSKLEVTVFLTDNFMLVFTLSISGTNRSITCFTTKLYLLNIVTQLRLISIRHVEHTLVV
jgi:hypothetical protein